MKRPALVLSIEILFFVALLLAVFFLLKPVNQRFEQYLVDLRDSVVEEIEDQTGLRISYKALSPSIFRVLKFSDLTITDPSTQTVVAHISKLSVSYSLGEILRGNFAGALREIILETGDISIDYEQNKQTIAFFAGLFKSEPNPDPETSSALEQFLSGSVSVRIRNISFSYSDANQLITGNIARGQIAITDRNISFELTCKAAYDRFALPVLGTLSTTLRLSGRFENYLSSGSIVLTIDTIGNKDFSVSQLGLIAVYRNGVLSVSSVQDLQPINMTLTYDIPGQALNLSVASRQLLPFRWGQLSVNNEFVSKLRNTVLTADLNVSFSAEQGLVYAANVDALIPPAFYGGGQLLASLNGDSSRINFDNLSFAGTEYDFSYTGSFDLKRIVPDGFLEVNKMFIPRLGTISGDMYVNPEGRGFICILPELTINDAVFSSVTVEIDTASWPEVPFTLNAYEDTGRISAEGTYSGERGHFLELFVGLDAIGVSNTLGILSGVYLPKDGILSSLQTWFDSYALTTEVYFSTDFSSFSFNCTRLVLASGQTDGLYVLLTAKGNETSVDITDIYFTPWSYNILGNVNIGFGMGSDVLFNASLEVNSYPYNFSGLVSKTGLSVYGDYNLTVTSVFNRDGSILGSCLFSGLPVPVGPMLLSLTLDSEFSYSSASNWKVSINNALIEEVGGFLPLSTIVQCIGIVDQTGVFLHSFTISDAYSTLAGYMSVNRFPSSSEGTFIWRK
ncbi:hypothetical protein K7I13_00330 [Brucepastera parasyntrophica]|uniref:hypothetical protein n=1 Tax=Brucepastera parasyntrophica TaxID=2880008 RepID=UPI00210E1F8B|nr:hypothetical protein [Brucepastera parasyntrophica]ULQ59843.1 hypothetical protein K7I13_00330 [Brucepastera parasyntrophica]